MPDQTQLNAEHTDAIRRIRAVFESADFSQSGIERLLGYDTRLSPVAIKIPGECLCLDGGSTLETLIRLFLLNRPVELATAPQAIDHLHLDDWVQAGLLRVDGQQIIPEVRILPYSDLLITTDRRRRITDQPSDAVMTIGTSTLMLAESTIRSPVGTFLDLGSGSGVQSLLAARHCQSVCGVDLNPRAVNFARFNAQLNGFEQIEFLQGDLFEPVDSQTFDLIVSNPPYVITPDFGHLYSDNSQQCDALCEQIIRQVPARLNERGVFQMYFDWAHIKDQSWQSRLAEWCRDNSCDGWVMRKETWTPSRYIQTWNKEILDKPEFQEVHDRWMAYYEQLGVEAISSGLITMRRRSAARNWFEVEDGPEAAIAPLGDDIRQLLDMRDWLEGISDDQTLLKTRFRIADNVRMDQQLKPTPRGWRIESARVRRTTGLGFAGDLNAETATFLHQSTGERTLGDLLQSIATQHGCTLADVAPSYLRAVRLLLSRGFLTIAPDVCESLVVSSAGVLAGESIAQATETHIC